MRLKRERVRASLFSDLLTGIQLKFTTVFFNHLRFKTHQHFWRESMKKENFKFLSNSDCTPQQLFQPSNEMMESMLSICLKIYFTSKRNSPKIKSSKIVSSLLLERSFSSANNCLNKECKVLKKLSKFQRTTTSR